MRRITGGVLTVLLLVPPGVLAQTASIDVAPASEIREPACHRVAGPLREAANREAARLAERQAPISTQQSTPPHRNWARRHPVLLGTLIGLGGGLAYNAPICGASSDYTCTGLGLFFGGIGAGMGAGVGGVVALALR